MRIKNYENSFGCNSSIPPDDSRQTSHTCADSFKLQAVHLLISDFGYINNLLHNV